jgi:hypothetical protein
LPALLAHQCCCVALQSLQSTLQSTLLNQLFNHSLESLLNNS